MRSLILTLLLLGTFCLAGCRDEGKTETSKGTTYDRVMQAGEIRCGYAMWAPALYKDVKADKITGIFYELMNEVGNRLDLKVVWAEESGWGTIVEGLNLGRYDMICAPLGHSSARAKFIAFGIPVFYTPMYGVVRLDDVRFDKDINKLNSEDYKIAVLDGELSSVTARQVFPEADTISLPQMNDYSGLLKEVEGNKADITLVEPSVFRTYEKTNPDKLKILDGGEPVNIFPVSVGFSRGDVEFKNMINVTLQELMNDGTAERMIQKYEEFPEAFVRPSKPYEVAK